MKRIIAVAAFASLLAPFAVNAQGWSGWGWWHPIPPPFPPPHQQISGDQMALAGLVAAAALSVVGYLAMRRRANA